MKIFVLIVLTGLLIGCFPKRKYLEPRGSAVHGEEPGYWKLINYRERGKLEDSRKASGKVLLIVKSFIMMEDSLQEPLYQKGFPYFIFSFYDSALNKTDSLKVVLNGNKYDRKKEISQFWYSINSNSGFAAFLNVDPGGNVETHSIELSNVMKSTTYKPELDSLRYYYEPTAKFR